MFLANHGYSDAKIMDLNGCPGCPQPFKSEDTDLKSRTENHTQPAAKKACKRADFLFKLVPE